ncbi:hypothetical protein ANANG_G00114380 [Anguilla anguilla]|uniref:AP3A hydrolase n=1 Tax=Anguilla anguilla TaxID=7936 RepID=A0A9D3MFQ4_ANGAN|nr:hypothetical protein ANANG_G00114380 [Anguilla anguilla]
MMANGLVKASCLLGVVAMAMLPSCRPEDPPRLLLVSFDGFRWDYVQRVATPNFHALMEEGVRVEQVESAYITKTFPDHYTLVTGLYTESHGIVANEMYDPDLNLTFSMDHPSARDPRWWDGAEPLWATNQRAGHGSGAAMWPGTDVEIRGTYPTHFLPYNASVGFEARVRSLVGWFARDPSVRLGLLYWEEPDVSGHAFGPDSSLMDAVIADVDAKLGFLRRELQRAGLYERLNLVVTSDHGMAQMSGERVVELDAYLSRDAYTWIDKSPVVGILPQEGKLEEVYRSLATPTPACACTGRRRSPSASTTSTTTASCPSSSPLRKAGPSCRTRATASCWVTMVTTTPYPACTPCLWPEAPPSAGPTARRRRVRWTCTRSCATSWPCRPRPTTAHWPTCGTCCAKPGPHAGPAPRPEPTYARVLGSLLGVVLVLGFLLVFLKYVTLRQLPATPTGNPEIARPLLQDHLEI